MVGQASVQRDGDDQRQDLTGDESQLHVSDGVHALPAPARGLAAFPANRGNAAGPGQLTGTDDPGPRSGPSPGARIEPLARPVASPVYDSRWLDPMWIGW